MVRAWAAVQGGPAQHLVMGPWRHCGGYHDGSTLGPLRFEGDTGLQFRRDILKPFFDFHLARPESGDPGLPRATIYNTDEPRWERFDIWPRAATEPARALHLHEAGLSWAPPEESEGEDAFVSDPAKPVPHAAPPLRLDDIDSWRTWLVADQRFAACRPDVLVYRGEVLEAAVAISGIPQVEQWASTTGEDANCVVKLIDVFPDETPSRPAMSGYQLPVAMEIFRARYRESPERAGPVAAGRPLSTASTCRP